MEVVVDGTLARAADGSGLLPFVRGPNGRIVEQARLFDAANLQRMVSAAALWQVASVIVAQKHLADISGRLKDIEAGIAGISRFLDDQRKARISGTYTYLVQVSTALLRGEFPEAARLELESCERDLIEIQDHLMTEYEQKASEAVEGGTWRTKKTCEAIEEKLTDLDLLARDIAACIETRSAAWVILSLYPGNPQHAMARRESIETSIRDFERLGELGQAEVEAEITSIGSLWRKKTVESRRSSLETECADTALRLSELSELAIEHIQQAEQAMRRAADETRLLVEVDDGVVVGVERAVEA